MSRIHEIASFVFGANPRQLGSKNAAADFVSFRLDFASFRRARSFSRWRETVDAPSAAG
jgi:hypothetical protein